MNEKYFVVPPVDGGEQWWFVNRHDDEGGTLGANTTMATFAVECPGAEKEARDLCAFLNLKEQRS